MRILFDSQQTMYKEPFGCLTPNQGCTLHIHIPQSVGASGVSCVFQTEDGKAYNEYPFTFLRKHGCYDVWVCQFSLPETGLFFYYFTVTGNTGTFRLFKQADGTNMEKGDLWQVSCIPAEFTTPDWAQGAVIYQVFPDRFYKEGDCDLTGKLGPYTVHADWNEEVSWQPDEKGQILNNDFYGGNFRGITRKLDYIASLGVTVLYLNPISKSFSNHRYDTGDYKTPDPMLGTEEDFRELCRQAHQRGIRVVLDGVYSHTGADSLYFDKHGHFGGYGASCTPSSPYYSWYTFHSYPDRYECWWDFDTLPTVRKLDPSFLDYIIESDHSVVAHWLSLGADGFRLDVVDELPNEFMVHFRRRVRQLRPDALVIGEVWEDASNKLAYGVRRRYFVDGTLDSIMNYPYRTAILQFLREQTDATAFSRQIMTVAENYPAQVLGCNMTLLGSHDTPRILTALVDDFDGPREALATRRLSAQELALAKERLLTATVLQYTLPGCPSIYYGDEVQMEGGKDPFNRRTYPWGRENEDLLSHYRSLGQLRCSCEALRRGQLEFFCAQGGRLGYLRRLPEQTLRVYVNREHTPWETSVDKVLLSHNMRQLSPKTAVLDVGGWCIAEDLSKGENSL